VGETLRVRALASSIGTTTGYEKFSYKLLSFFFYIKLYSDGASLFAYFYSVSFSFLSSAFL
jgi:hypothetical protein